MIMMISKNIIWPNDKELYDTKYIYLQCQIIDTGNNNIYFYLQINVHHLSISSWRFIVQCHVCMYCDVLKCLWQRFFYKNSTKISVVVHNNTNRKRIVLQKVCWKKYLDHLLVFLQWSSSGTSVELPTVIKKRLSTLCEISKYICH